MSGATHSRSELGSEGASSLPDFQQAAAGIAPDVARFLSLGVEHQKNLFRSELENGVDPEGFKEKIGQALDNLRVFFGENDPSAPSQRLLADIAAEKPTDSEIDQRFSKLLPDPRMRQALKDLSAGRVDAEGARGAIDTAIEDARYQAMASVDNAVFDWSQASTAQTRKKAPAPGSGQ